MTKHNKAESIDHTNFDSKQQSRIIEFYLFFSGYFFSQIVYGQHNEGVLLNLGILQLSVAIFAVCKYPPSRRSVQVVGLFFLILVLLELIFSARGRGLPGWESDYLLAAGKLWAYLFGLMLFALTLRREDVEEFCRAFVQLSVLSIGVAGVTYFIYIATGYGVLLNYYGGADDIVRPQAFFSEPSAFAPVISTALFIGIKRRSPILVFFGLIGALITQSPVVILTVIMTGFVLSFIKAQLVVRGISIILMSYVALTLVSMDCVEARESASPVMVAVARAACGVQSITNENMLIDNPRLISAYKVIELMQEQDAWWSGFGLNSSSIFMEELFGEIRENSFWLSLLLFYGVLGVVVYACISVLLMLQIRRVDFQAGVMFISLFFASLINSAGGFYMYGLLLVMMVVVGRSAVRGDYRVGRK